MYCYLQAAKFGKLSNDEEIKQATIKDVKAFSERCI
jgi:hypothetical protein